MKTFTFSESLYFLLLLFMADVYGHVNFFMCIYLFISKVKLTGTTQVHVHVLHDLNASFSVVNPHNVLIKQQYNVLLLQMRNKGKKIYLQKITNSSCLRSRIFKPTDFLSLILILKPN